MNLFRWYIFKAWYSLIKLLL